MEDEHTLVERAKRDKDAFTKLYNIYYPRLYAYLLARTGLKERAEDVTQEAFVKAVKALKQGRYHGVSFGAWIFTIAKNELVDVWRKEHKVHSAEPDVLERHTPAAESAEDDMKAREDEADTQKRYAALSAALKKLSDEEQNLIAMKYIAGLSYKDIAEASKKRPKTLAVQLYRAIQKLRAEMNQSNRA